MIIGENMTEEIIAMIFSILGMLMNIIGFQVKNKKTLLLFQTIGSTMFLISFVFNASGMAVILNVIYLIRNFLYMYLDDKPQYNRLFCIVLSSVFVISYIVYTLCANLPPVENLWNIAPIAASIFGTIAASCTDVNKYRMWKYGDSYCWLFFNARFGLGALGGVIGELFNQISLTVGIIRYRNKSKTE
jgi:hypothetical protein